MTHDIAIIGGGISGLSLAFHCARAGKRTLVLERDPQVGGCVDSRAAGDDFWLELGAHTCYRSYAAIWELVRGVGLEDRAIARQKVPFRLWTDGKSVSVRSALSLPSLFFSLPRAFWTRKATRTMRGYYGAILGRRNYDRTLRYFFNAVMSQDVDDFPADMLFKRRKVKDPTAPARPRSFTFAGGLSSLLGALAAPRPELTVTCDAEVVSLGPLAGGGFRLRTGRGAEIEARALALACPPDQARRLVGPLHPDVAAHLPVSEVAAIESQGVVVEAERCPLPPVAGIVGRDEPFFSVIARDTVAHQRLRGFSFHFRPGVSPEDREQTIERVVGVPRASWVHRTARRSTLPTFRPGHQARLAALDALIAARPLLVTGNYLAGASLEDCAARSAAEFQRWERLGFPAAV